MHITVNNYFNTTSAAYRQNFPQKLCKTDSEGTLRFNRELIEAESANLPSFVGKVYTKEELMQSVEQQVQRNQGKKLPLEEMKKCSSSMGNGVSDDKEQVTISAEEGLQTWYEGRTLAEWALTDPQYTDSETGFSWYVRDGKHPYMVGKDAEKFKEMCQETGESWLKKFAEMTGMIQYLDDNTVAYVGTNGIAVKSKDGKELSVDTSSLTYDMIQSLLQNMRGGGNYFDSQHWQEAIQKIKYNAVS